MGIHARSWRKRGRTCEAVVELPQGGIYVCGKYTTQRDGRCDEHREPVAPRGAGRHQKERRL